MQEKVLLNSKSGFPLFTMFHGSVKRKCLHIRPPPQTVPLLGHFRGFFTGDILISRHHEEGACY